MPFRKADPLVEAQAAVDRIEAQRRPLAERLTTADARVQAAQRARHEALVNGDPDAETTALLDKACSDATEARGGVDTALRAVVLQLSEATQARDALQDGVARSQVAKECERRAAALDAAAEGLTAAATAFGDARAAMVTAIAQHGVRIDNPLMVGGSAPAALLARPITMAAVRLAAPGVLPAADGFGAVLDADPVMVTRRAQSGKLRDHAEDVLTGRAPADEPPRPGDAAVLAPGEGPLAREPKAMAVFDVPFSYLAANGYSLISAEEGQAEVPERVALKGREMKIAHDVGSPEGNAVVARLAAGGRFRARPRVFVDTDADAEGAPTPTARTVTTTWPDEGRR